MAVNTPRCQRSHWHTCKACDGAGELTVRHYTGNPELETGERCKDCRGDGGYQFARTDALETLAGYRRLVLKSSIAFGQSYLSQRARCFRKVAF